MDGSVTIFETDPETVERNRQRKAAARPTGPVALFVSVCSGRGWHGQFGYSLAQMMTGLGISMGDTRARVERGEPAQDRIAQVCLGYARQTNVVCSRQDHIVKAIKEGYTHFLSLDDDMTFPQLTATRMLEHGKPVVTVNYRKKTDERIECVCSDFEGGFVSSQGKTGLERIRGFGMGVTLIDLKAIAHIPLPYFAIVWNTTSQSFIIEDTVFANVLDKHGVEVWCDHDLSRDVGHVGDYEFRLP